MLRHLLALWVPLSLFAAAPTGLKIVSTTIDPQTRSVIVKAQNMTDKTIVGHLVMYHTFDTANHEITPPEGAGILDDYNVGPQNPTRFGFIGPGQIGTIQGYAAGRNIVSVKAEVVTVIFEDDTTEGEQAGAHAAFSTRRDRGKEAREQAAQEPAGSVKKAELERRAAWFEAHSPKEANQ